MTSLSFVKEGDEAAAAAAEQERKIVDKRPLAVILQANREAKEAEMAAKLKARDQLLTVTDDDIAFEATQEDAKHRREVQVAMETQRALEEFRSAVAERVVVAAAPEESTASSTNNATSALKRSAESALAPVLPPVKKAAVVPLAPLVHVRKAAGGATAVAVKAQVTNKTSSAAVKKPSAGMALLGGYDDSSSSE